MNLVTSFITLVLVALLILSVMNFAPRTRDWRWFCDRMGWHKAPNVQTFDGCSNGGQCPRCGASVLQDSQGNWFLKRQP